MQFALYTSVVVYFCLIYSRRALDGLNPVVCMHYNFLLECDFYFKNCILYFLEQFILLIRRSIYRSVCFLVRLFSSSNQSRVIFYSVSQSL